MDFLDYDAVRVLIYNDNLRTLLTEQRQRRKLIKITPICSKFGMEKGRRLGATQTQNSARLALVKEDLKHVCTS